MSWDEQAELRRWFEERNKGLRKLDMAWARKILPPHMSDEACLIAMHKARLDIPSMGALRMESAHWLNDRGYKGRNGVDPFLAAMSG